VSSLKTRTISSVILLFITVSAILWTQWSYTLLIALVIVLAAYEYVHMFKVRGYALSQGLVWAMNLIWLADAMLEQSVSLLAPGLAAFSMLTALWILWRRQTQTTSSSLAAEWALTLAGGIYFGMGGAYLLRVRAFPEGLWWILTAFPIIWMGESMAYLVGSRWGKHKIAPQISPGKSWEGFAAEFISSSLTGAGLGALWPVWIGPTLTLNVYNGLFLGCILSVFTPAGDFFISLLKREIGVKDTGTLIPGHGGMLDRIDSLLWAGFITWAVIKLLG